MKSTILALSVATIFSGCVAQNDTPQGSAEQDHEHEDSTDHGVAAVNFPVSCDESVQDDFNAAVAALHNMTYNVAKNRFEAILDRDPDCGMAHWGVAMSHIHPLWGDSPSPEAMEDGLARVAAARETTLNPRETAYVDALATYYENADVELYERLKIFAGEMEEVQEQFPDDLEARAFHAVTHLSTMPPGSVDMEIIEHASGTAFEVLEEEPDHPGGHHYVIHAFDYPGLADRALEVARSYSELAPDNPHSLHMPSHIFTRLGLWDGSIELNRRSAEVAKDQPFGDAVSIHYLHALDYMLYGYLQTGQETKARAVVDSVQAVEPPIQVHPVSAYHLAAADARWSLERHEWEAAASIQPRTPGDFPWDDFPAFEALSHFAVAVGAARSENKPKATEAILRLIELEEKTAHPYWKDQVKVMRLASQAWLHEAVGTADRAEEVMQESADLEAGMSKHPTTPGEVLPASELLGDMLLLHGKPAEALAAYESSLERTPNRFNSLFGAGQAAEAMGQNERAGEFFGKLVEVCDEADTDRAELAYARNFVAS